MKSERTIRRKVKELKKALIFPGGSEMTKPCVLWVQEMYESQGDYLSVGTSRRGVQHGVQHSASRKFLEKLLGVRLSSFQKKKSWPQTYPIYFRVVR